MAKGDGAAEDARLQGQLFHNILWISRGPLQNVAHLFRLTWRFASAILDSCHTLISFISALGVLLVRGRDRDRRTDRELCRRHAMPAVAVTDSGNLFGAFEFSTAAAAAGVQAILVLSPVGDAQRCAPRTAQACRLDQLVLLVQNETGYRNLSSLGQPGLSGGRARRLARVDLVAFEGHSEGLMALSGGVPAMSAGTEGATRRMGRGHAADARSSLSRPALRRAAAYHGAARGGGDRRALDRSGLQARSSVGRHQ